MTAVFARTTFHDALTRLADPHLLRELSYVGGRWTAGLDGASFKVTDPASNATLAWVAELDAGQTEEAVSAASDAFPAWRDLLPQQRARILRQWGELMLEHREDLALLMTLEQGKPLAESRGEIDYAASFVEWYAEEGKRLNAESVTSHLPGAEMIVRREALGVDGAGDRRGRPPDPQRAALRGDQSLGDRGLRGGRVALPGPGRRAGARRRRGELRGLGALPAWRARGASYERCLRDEPLAVAVRVRLGPRERALERRAVRDDLVNEARVLRLLGRDGRAREQPLERGVCAHDVDQARGAAPAGGDGEASLRPMEASV